MIHSLLNWVHWPFYIFYLPIAPFWISYYFRTGSFWFYTASNPTLTFGGFEGEAKTEMYSQLPEKFCPRTESIHPFMTFSSVLEQVQKRAFSYPFIVKPDVGMKGLLFRKIESEDQLKKYHEQMPVTYLVQEFINYPLEISIFYLRKPGDQSGRITAMIQKNLPTVEGDGSSSLQALIEKKFTGKELKNIRRDLSRELHSIPPKGKQVIVSHIANLYNGAFFTNLTSRINDRIQSLFDNISWDSQFLYGRYDIKAASVDAFCRGEDFYILEFNGAGSVPNHIYTGDYTLTQSYREILKHWRWMYEISRENRESGIPYYSFRQGFHFLRQSKKHFNQLKKLDKVLIP
jgi:hypothetical protein